MAKVLSTEDRNLEVSSINSSKVVEYKDFDLTLEMNPATKDIYKKKDAAAVKQAVKTLLLTDRFEKPFRPFFGAGLNTLLFELATDATGIEIEKSIIQTIQRYEPRCIVKDLKVNSLPDNNTISVKLEFQIVNTQQIVSFETAVSRLR